MTTTDSLDNLTAELKQFAIDRDWLQFHSPKNLAMAISGEAAELSEHFLWLTTKESNNLTPEQLQQVALEIADIQIYLIRVAEVLDIDIIASVYKKIALNQKRFPKTQK